jgi:hypothetical protein
MGMYVDTTVWVESDELIGALDDEDIIREFENRGLMFSGAPPLSVSVKLIHSLYVARTQDNVKEINYLLDELFLEVLGKKV